MKQDTLAHIKFTLLKNKSFVFPGLGVFSLKRNASYFSENNSKLNPPIYDIIFSDKIEDYQIFSTELDSELTALASNISTQLLTNKSYTIPSFGSFEIIDNNEIKFEASSVFKNYFNPGYEPIDNISQVNKTFAPTTQNIHTVSTESLVYEKPKSDKPLISIERPEKINWKWIIIGFTIVGLILCFFFCPRPAMSFDYFKSKPKSEYINNTPKTEDSINNTNPNSNNVNGKIDEKLSESDSITLSRKNKNLPCAVITASLKNPKYVIQMVTKLESSGYTVYTEETDSTTRIGVKYDCSQQEVDTLLREIRSKIDSKSWVLR